MTKALSVCLSTLLIGCAPMPDIAHSQSRYMSAAWHRQQAAEEETKAAADEYEAHQASSSGGTCGSPTTTLAESASVDDVCLSTRRQAAEQYERAATEHRKDASQHRVAAEELDEAEAKACKGLSTADRVVSPFHRWRNIEVVHPRLDGATIVFAEVPGLTRDYMQRVMDCQMARDAVLGYDVPQAEDSPLALKGVESVVVTQQSQGLAVTITSSEHPVAVEISARARRLITGEPKPTPQAIAEPVP